MHTYFASPERTAQAPFQEEIRIINDSSLMQVFLNSISGLLAIVDENRQIVAVNDLYLKTLGIENPQQVLGLRPGESVHCVHAGEEPGGCGTSRFCSSCGAAIAMTISLAKNCADERDCAIETYSGG